MMFSRLCRQETHATDLGNLEVTAWCLIFQVLRGWGGNRNFSPAYYLPPQKQRVHRTGSKYGHA